MQLEEQVSTLLAEYGQMVEAAIEEIIPKDFREENLVELGGRPKYEYEPVSVDKSVSKPFWDLMSRGGKRWRPALALLTYESLGGNPRDILHYAAIPEIIHNGTLIVDDVEDDSLMRRNRPCIHRTYGVDVAINAGNTLYYLPVVAILGRGDKEKNQRILETYIRQMFHLSLGQAMDIAWHRGLVENVTEEHYLQMCAFKTGSISRLAVEIACILAETSQEMVQVLGDFGESIGVAFQIQDDLLNLLGDEAAYGKEWGGDVAEGKRSLMVVHALRHLPTPERDRLKSILSIHRYDRPLIEEAVDLIKRSGSVEYAVKVARDIVQRSWSRIDEVLPPSEAKKKMRALAEFLIERSH